MNKIREIRESKGLSGVQLADKMGTDSQLIYRYETGQTKLTIERTHEFAKALGVSIEEIIGTKPLSQKNDTKKASRLHPTDDVRVYERVVAAMHELQELGLRISGSKAASAIFATVAKYIQAEIDAGRNPNEETIHGRITAEVKKLQTKMKN